MKLSEAVRLGSMLNEQGNGLLVSRDGKTCALGAAGRAVGLWIVNEDVTDTRIKRLGEIFPSLNMPISELGLIKLYHRIIHLNDTLGWSREAIADEIVRNGWDCEAVLPEEQNGCEKQTEAEKLGSILPSVRV